MPGWEYYLREFAALGALYYSAVYWVRSVLVNLLRPFTGSSVTFCWTEQTNARVLYVGPDKRVRTDSRVGNLSLLVFLVTCACYFSILKKLMWDVLLYLQNLCINALTSFYIKI